MPSCRWAGRRRVVVAIAVGLAASAGAGCAAARREGRADARERASLFLRETDFHCARAAMDRYSPYRMPLAGAESDPTLAAYLVVLPPEARRAALAAGLEPMLARLLRDKATAGLEPTSRLMALQDELTLRLVAFHAQVAAAAFEAGCTADMIQKVLAERSHREQSRQVSIAVASLVAGALAGVAAGVWGLANPESRAPPILAIAGGVAGTGLGAGALLHEDPPALFEHARNRLTPVWRGVDPDHLYPSFVFRMLTFPPVAGGHSPRDQLIGSWQQQLGGALPVSSLAAAEQLLLGDGGIYDDQLFTLRAEMFEGLESAVQGMARDLELLNRSLVRVLTAPAP
jgi:hypothetical protein